MIYDYVIRASYGNDSVALIQWAYESGLSWANIAVLYNDTGWASDDWPARVAEKEEWARSLGLHPHRTTSIGLEQLVRDRKGWPRQGIQFCTAELKIYPTLRWLDEHDPARLSTQLIGVRRAESTARANFIEFVAKDPNNGDRDVWAPLVRHTDEDRDALLQRAGVEPLLHRSKECYPCINSNRADLQGVTEKRIAQIEDIEMSMGYTSKGKPRTMFRPYRYMGATGIREIVRWANSERGEFDPDDGGGAGCEAGWCGT